MGETIERQKEALKALRGAVAYRQARGQLDDPAKLTPTQFDAAPLEERNGWSRSSVIRAFKTCISRSRSGSAPPRTYFLKDVLTYAEGGEPPRRDPEQVEAEYLDLKRIAARFGVTPSLVNDRYKTKPLAPRPQARRGGLRRAAVLARHRRR